MPDASIKNFKNLESVCFISNLPHLNLLAGRSILFASGDSGVDCKAGCINKPDWPASSPFITSIGATHNPDSESGTSWSGGGFSNYFVAPEYQQQAIKDYINTYGPAADKMPNPKSYNATGRGYPDISAFGVNFVIVRYRIFAKL